MTTVTKFPTATADTARRYKGSIQGTALDEPRDGTWEAEAAIQMEMAAAAEGRALVITFQAPNGDSIHLTQAQIAAFHRAGTWPRNSRGEEFCSVSHGLHMGTPSMTDAPTDD